MRICRFNSNRIGLVEDNSIIDITQRLDLSPKWPSPPGEWVVSQLTSLNESELRSGQPSIALSDVRLESPVANPGKIIGAPINYKATSTRPMPIAKSIRERPTRRWMNTDCF